MAYRNKAEVAGVTPRTATVLKNIAKNLTALANQYETLAVIANEERRHIAH
ncbi:hypothetical protein JQ631_26750 [Bradyrhizobium manausense]|uniref:hypothetical protein n=1 Tax=Bradyrhizobium manausense TaxID=989370 RepID=UPI001BADA46C|nr:hypothetical protein [Bradyrhizobium manausense]MBR0792689.1 hypothetical protein [Bradyrhizobium manausense]